MEPLERMEVVDVKMGVESCMTYTAAVGSMLVEEVSMVVDQVCLFILPLDSLPI